MNHTVTAFVYRVLEATVAYAMLICMFYYYYYHYYYYYCMNRFLQQMYRCKTHCKCKWEWFNFNMMSEKCFWLFCTN